METAFFSQSWYRVAAMRPQLRSHVRIHRHYYRGQEWYVMQDDSTGKFHRFSSEAYYLIGLMDGRHSLESLWENACEALGDEMPTQDEVLSLLSQLYRADALQSDLATDVGDLFKRFADEKKQRRLNILRSPTSIKIPVFDPDKLLNALSPVVLPLLGRWGAVLWLGVVLPALCLVFVHWQELTSGMADRLFAMENLVLIGLAYPVLKLFHEFGHAFAVKKWGAQVHEMGVMFLVFVPMPYVDASASTAFSDKKKRMLVGGAGILVEIFAAALAVLIWVNVEPGGVRAVAYNVMVIAGVSTLFFNGNPLLKFDAYYVLSDWLEIPNLAMRGNQHLGYLTRRWLLGIRDAVSPAAAPGESGWLGTYAVLAFIYRIFISIRIVLLVAGKFFFMGVLLAVWSGFSMLVMPLVGSVKRMVSDRAISEKKGRIGILALGISGAIILGLFLIPAPRMTVAQGVVWPPEQSDIHARSDGFIRAIKGAEGQVVEAGETLFICEDLELDAEMAVLRAQIEELDARYRLSATKDRTETRILKDELAHLNVELGRYRERKKELTIVSPQGGTLFLPQVRDRIGRFVRRGENLGYVVDFSVSTVRVVVSQEDVDRVRNDVSKITARFSGGLDRVVSARVLRIVPAASRALPSMALSLEGGGEIVMDPRGGQEPQAFQKWFHVEIALSEVLAERIGERVYVRFEHAPEPLFFRLYRKGRRLLLNRFGV
ncbi:HlyD family efflux transporter periplasmic adaptor subunit [Desulfoluna sp.]|uniref:HlyD family efflux transporter periplasmic adaptor subunit n=1 Tax=Desulfoluna sp. TaxID=2045199 RepID=UPI00261CC290|nr:HlyD family efflux transporter periplasmic adaptor subunit [Desulfoluna sp.]